MGLITTGCVGVAIVIVGIVWYKTFNKDSIRWGIFNILTPAILIVVFLWVGLFLSDTLYDHFLVQNTRTEHYTHTYPLAQIAMVYNGEDAKVWAQEDSHRYYVTVYQGPQLAMYHLNKPKTKFIDSNQKTLKVYQSQRVLHLTKSQVKWGKILYGNRPELQVGDNSRSYVQYDKFTLSVPKSYVY